jgi:hypothetical protein
MEKFDMKAVEDMVGEMLICPNDDQRDMLGNRILFRFREVLQFVKNEEKARLELAEQIGLMAAKFPDEDTLHQALEDADARIAVAERLGEAVKKLILDCPNAPKYHECCEPCEVGDICSILAEFYGKQNDCEHEWIKASNEKIDRFNYCPKCDSVMLGSL